MYLFVLYDRIKLGTIKIDASNLKSMENVLILGESKSVSTFLMMSWQQNVKI